MSPEYTANSYWDAFVDFVFIKKQEHQHMLHHDIERDLLDKMLAFHHHNRNLFWTPSPDGFAFMVVRPVKEVGEVEFDWEQPESDIYLLDFLYSSCKKATLRLWKQMCDTIASRNIFYYRFGRLKTLDRRLVAKLFYEVGRKDK
jgi:hypothetical protein